MKNKNIFRIALVPLIALVIKGSPARALQEPPGLLGVLALNSFFVMLFVVSAMLFRRADLGNSKAALINPQ